MVPSEKLQCAAIAWASPPFTPATSSSRDPCRCSLTVAAGAGSTVTGRVHVRDTPCSSVTVALTLYVPGPGKTCVMRCSPVVVAPVPSPKSIVTGETVWSGWPGATGASEALPSTRKSTDGEADSTALGQN